MQAETRESLQRRLKTLHRNLAALEEQKAKMGLDVTVRVLNEIEDTKQQIAELEDHLAHGDFGTDGRFLGMRPPRIYHNLPQPDYGTFIDREEELAQVYCILRPYPHSQHALVTIDGIGGIGKSALALEVAHRHLRDYDCLPEEERFEAIIWTSAKSSVLTADGIAPRQQITRTLEDIYTTISVALEREDITHARPEEQGELVTKALTRQRTLLIVDNLETVDDERVNAFLRELPAPTKAIVTTRHRIDVAYPVRLTGMPKEDGLALIAQECAKKSVTLAEAEAEELYDRTGGVPLAIVWSVAQMGYGYGVGAVLRRLGQPSEDISRFCFERVMEHIRSTDAHELLMALALFATDAGREALGYVAGLGEDVLSRGEGLVTLERLSLVNKSGERFWMLPLTKAFVSAEESGETRSRYIEFFVKFCQQQVGTKYWDGLRYDARKMEPELENVFLAFDWAFAAMNWKAVQSIFVGVVHSLAFSQVTLSKRVGLAEKALVAAGRLGDTEMLAWIHIDALGFALKVIGKPDEALNYLKIGQLIAQKARLVDCHVIAETHLAHWAMEHGNYSGAFQHIENALSNADSPIAKVRACMARTRFHLRRGEWEKARESALFAAEMASEVGYNLDEVFARMELGESYLRMGELDSAEKAYLKAQELANKYGWLKNLADSMMGLSELSYIRGDIQLACDYAEKARAIYEQRGMRPGPPVAGWMQNGLLAPLRRFPYRQG
jgi:tetratricopeptide (TPR) repeat protein